MNSESEDFSKHGAKLEPGRELGHYRVLSLLATGGMGQVYLAQDQRLGRQIALKAGAKVGGAIAEKLGSIVMKLVMKEVFVVDDDAERIINEVKKIVNEEIESNEISRVEGTIDGTIIHDR